MRQQSQQSALEFAWRDIDAGWDRFNFEIVPRRDQMPRPTSANYRIRWRTLAPDGGHWRSPVQPQLKRSAAYSYPRVIHRSEESPQELLPAASVNNSAAQKVLGMNLGKISSKRENTHRPATNYAARRSKPTHSPSSQAMRWSLTNTQRRTASISRSHYKPFARISQRVFRNL